MAFLEDDEDDGCKNDVDLFAEQAETLELIQNIERDISFLGRLRTIFDKYLECPTLLDPCLEELVHKISDMARTVLQRHAEKEESPSSFEQLPLRAALSALYALGKVRGHKIVQRFLPSTVPDITIAWNGLQKALSLSSVHHTDQSNLLPPLWESVYTLWNWMAALSYVPFDSCKIMGDKWMDEFVQVCLASLSDPGPTREAAAVCLGKWLSRQQQQSEKEFMSDFVSGACSVLVEYNNAMSTSFASHRLSFQVLGVLQTLTTILKVCTDRKLLQLQNCLWDTVCNIHNHNNTSVQSNLLLRKLILKWYTRMCCQVLLPLPLQRDTHANVWRYQCGNRTLADPKNHSSSITDCFHCHERIDKQPVANKHENYEEEDDNDDLWINKSPLHPIPGEVEEAMGELLDSLSHSATVVRWSAAKGIGRVTERLPPICAEDILDALLDMLREDPDRDRAWHGVCLALAELARRALLRPKRLKDVVVFLIEAVHYDRRRGHTSVGAHVRDAACYTYWAFARAYNPEILRPYLPQLNEAIVLTSLFDREVNCRRGASAAFQEAVGRQGATNCPRGIEILTLADYLSLGNRTESFLSISRQIAHFDEYRRPIIQNLSQVKLFHWDQSIRALSSKSLAGLVSLDPEYFCDTILPILTVKCLDERDLSTRHGAVLGVAEIILALSEHASIGLLSKNTIEAMISLVPSIEKKRLFRGRGGEIMRSAVCRLIECISQAKLLLSVKEQVRILDSVDANISHPTESIQQSACQALSALMSSYFPVGSNGPSDRLQKRVVDQFIEKSRSSDNPAITRGYALALGYLPAKLIAPSKAVLARVIDCLRNISNPSALVGGESDAETRRNALLSLNRIIMTVGFVADRDLLFPSVTIDRDGFESIFSAFREAMEDYNTDRRGDVGSWCRANAMEGITELTIAASKSSFNADERQTTLIVALLLKQLAERLDIVRECAGACLTRLLLQEEPHLRIRAKDHVIDALGIRGLKFDERHWSNPSLVYPLLMSVASIEEGPYFEFLASGLVASVGSLTADVSKHATLSLLRWMKDGDVKRRTNMGEFLISTLRKCSSERIIVPALKSLHLLFSHRFFDQLVQSSSNFSNECLASLEKVASGTDIHRLIAIVDATIDLLVANPRDNQVQNRATSFLCKMLNHKFPRIRDYTAQQLYVYLLESEKVDTTNALDLLLQTQWSVISVTLGESIAEKIAQSLCVPDAFASMPI
jgi:hypothetical protein